MDASVAGRNSRGERSIRVTLMRGGTSKGVFVAERDLPDAGPERDAFLLALMGSPDPMQIDGLGGTHSSTSKVVAVSRSDRQGVDVEYLFAQVGIDRAVVDYTGNCGNLTSAVAPFALMHGMVEAGDPSTAVRLFNRNTSTQIVARVATRAARLSVDGDEVVDGVPGRGAPIEMDYLHPAGAVLGVLLPTGNLVDEVTDCDGRTVRATIMDVAGPAAFVAASDLRLPIDVQPATVNSDARLLKRIESVRSSCAAVSGMTESAAVATAITPALPRLVLVGAGNDVVDLTVRVMSMQRMHHATPLTTLLCTAAAVNIAGTIPADVCSRAREGAVRVGHPRGVARARADVTRSASDSAPIVSSVGVTSTARRLLVGEAFVRQAAVAERTARSVQP